MVASPPGLSVTEPPGWPTVFDIVLPLMVTFSVTVLLALVVTWTWSSRLLVKVAFSTVRPIVPVLVPSKKIASLPTAELFVFE